MQLRVGQRVPAMLFVDQLGQPFMLQALRGEAVILAFVCTRCRDAARCEGISGEFAYLQHRLPRGIRLVEITFDPRHDTNDVLAAYGKRFGADPERWTLATDTDLASVAHFAAAFGMQTPVAKPFGRRDDRRHVDRITLLDSQGRIAGVLDDGGIMNPDELLREARVVAGLTTSPAERLEMALRRVSALPPRNQHVVELVVFAAPAGLFLIGLVIRSLLIASAASASTRHRRAR